MRQPARADPVGALFVFLYLLKREPESVAELFLADAEFNPVQTHTSADMRVNRVEEFLTIAC